MVYIRKVEISGFKSFARKSTILNLDKGLVCITGPNGSGKSNILDAIAFALGENSVRVLRVDRLQSLIHDSNGRSKGERVGDDAGEEDDDGVNDSTTTIVVEARERDRKRRAVRVSITFDNSDRGIPLDSNTVTITREMYGNGENQYYLNGKHVNKSTITNMLDVALATPNKLNIVQQGMVMRIAELNPEERRRIIEEIIGLAYFDEKKEEAMKQLVEADRRLEVALARMGEIRSRIDELEQERNDQLRLEFLAREIERLKRIQIRSMLKHTRERLTTLESIAVAPPNPALALIAEHVSIPVIAQHVDDKGEGSTTGYNVAKMLRSFNIRGSIVNHSEHRLLPKEIEGIVKALHASNMLSIVCVREPDEIDTIAGLEFEPDYIAIEPPELIGTGNAVSKSKPEVITGSVGRAGRLGLRSKVICGAGIVDGRDAMAAIRLGSRGVLVASGIVKAENWYEKIKDIASNMLK